MTTGFKINSYDLSDLFKPYVNGTKTSVTGYRVGAVDISDLFQKYTFGPNSISTNISLNNRTSDLNSIFQKNMSYKTINNSQQSPSGTSSAVSVINYNNNNIYVGGTFTSIGSTNASNIAVYNGTAWSAFSSGLGVACNDILVVNNASIYVCGSFATPYPRIALWNGTAWSGLGSGLFNTAFTLERDGSNNIYVGGVFTRLSGGSNNDYTRVAMWNGTWNRIPSGSATGQNGFNGGNCQVIKYNSVNKYVYFGGVFTGYYNKSTTVVTCNRVAYYNGSLFSTMGSGTNGTTVNTIEVSNDGTVYVGGDFTVVNGNINASYVAKWDITTNTWGAVGNGLNGIVKKLKWNNGLLYASGAFTALGGNTSTLLNYVSVFDGTEWRIIDNSIGPSAKSIDALEVTSNALYVGGTFTTPFNNLAEYS